MTDLTASAGRGRLAEVLATRGGRAEPEAPFVIEHREALMYMLCEAAELEHGLMCQYLFAAFSLKQRADEGLTPEELDAVTRWRRMIAHVATEEMLHVALVQNVLTAIGAGPHLTRPNLPAPARHYPAGVNLTLVPFGEPALQHFMFLEDYRRMLSANAAFDPVRPVMFATVRRGEHDDSSPLIGDCATSLCPDLFNVSYEILLQTLERYFAHTEERRTRRLTLLGPSSTTSRTVRNDCTGS